MSEHSSTPRPFSTGQLLKGLAVGVLIGGACLVLNFFLGMMLSNMHLMFLGSVVAGVALIGIAFFAIKRSQDSGFLRGLLIALALALIASTMCGVTLQRGLLRF